MPWSAAELVEVADRCWVARHAFLDVNVGVVAGERGLLVVDTHASEPAARGVVENLRRLGRGEVVAVVNTHHHFDHTFGNAVLAEEYPDADLVAHEAAAALLAETAPEVQRDAARRAAQEQQEYAAVAAARVAVPATTFTSVRALDLGDRLVEVLHPGRGHTAGDAVVRVADADALFAGDLVEESALRSGVPDFGEDCYPLEWPQSLDLTAQLLTDDTVVVPGHGAPVGREFVLEQRAAIALVAHTVADLAGRGVPVTEAAAAAQWPYPVEELEHAIRRGYAHLPRGQRRLPLA